VIGPNSGPGLKIVSYSSAPRSEMKSPLFPVRRILGHLDLFILLEDL
jgi:hypothetical protein